MRRHTKANIALRRSTTTVLPHQKWTLSDKSNKKTNPSIKRNGCSYIDLDCSLALSPSITFDLWWAAPRLSCCAPRVGHACEHLLPTDGSEQRILLPTNMIVISLWSQRLGRGNHTGGTRYRWRGYMWQRAQKHTWFLVVKPSIINCYKS